MADPNPLRSSLRRRLTRARLDRDRPVAAALRSALAALENAEAVPGAEPLPGAGSQHVAGAVAPGAAEAARRALTVEEEVAILEAEVRSLRDAAGAYADSGRTDEASAARRAADVLAAVLGDG